MDQQYSQPKPVKPVNNSKPPVKSWSELLSPTNAGNNTNTANITNSATILASNNSGNSAVISASRSSGSSSGGPSRPTSAISLEIDFESLKLVESSYSRACPDSEFLYAPLNYLQSRPIVNPGNRCYMIAVLQVLLHTRLFSNYLQKYFFKLEMAEIVLKDARFPLLCALKNFYRQFAQSKDVVVSAVCHEVIDEIFLALKMKNCFIEAGFAEQEDAEEFLTAFLDSLGEEFSAIQAQKLMTFSLPFEENVLGNLNDDSDDWLQVGPKQRVATTRRTPVSQSPIHALFAGSFQSLYRSPGTRPSITFEPFTILPLSCSDMGIESIEGAIEHVLRCEDLGRRCSKQLSFASLPPLLIIQLKRFIYKANRSNGNELELHKITKPLKIPPNLNLQTCAFKLYAAVNHHGSSLHAGHYTASIQKDGCGGGWNVFDDDARIQRVGENGILNQNSSAYLLFYERQ